MDWIIENYTDTPTATLEGLTWEYLEETTGEINGTVKKGTLFCDADNRFIRFITEAGEVFDEAFNDMNEGYYNPEI